jgi:hypothetical protein
MSSLKYKNAVGIGGKIGMLVALPAILSLMSACSAINIKAAQALSGTGRNVAVQTHQNISISDQEYLRVRDAEALFHGLTNTTDSQQYTEILKKYKDIYQELAKRSVVFEKLANLYDAFGELAGLDTGGQTEKALAELGGAIEEYSKQIKQTSPIYSDTISIISKIGGLIATEIQKAKIKEASIQIRARVEDILKLLGNSFIREQMTGFREYLISDRKIAFSLLWNEGLYDPTPLINDFGADVGFAARKDVAMEIKPDTPLGNALLEVLEKRLTMKADLIERSYNASLASLAGLIAEHKKLEKGVSLDITRVQAIVAELRDIAILLLKVRSDVSKD